MAAKLLPLATAANAANCRYKSLILLSGAPYGNRTRVSAVKGRRPGPLDEGRIWQEPAANAAGHIESFGRAGKQSGNASADQDRTAYATRVQDRPGATRVGRAGAARM